MITWKDFFDNEWKSISRSPMAGQTIALKIMWGVLFTLLLVQMTGLGYFLPILLRRQAPGTDPIKTVNGILWGYFLFDLLLRIMISKIPATIIQQYLHCNIGREKIARYLMVKSLFNPVNAIGLCLWGTFTLSNSGIAGGGLLWFVGIFTVICINTMLILFAASFKRMAATLAVGGTVAAIAVAFEYYHMPILRDSVRALFTSLGNGNAAVLAIPAAILGGLIVIVYRKIQALMYVDLMAGAGMKISVQQSEIVPLSGLRFEWLLIYRNKRLRTMMIMMYGLFGPSMLMQLFSMNSEAGKPAAAFMAFMCLALFFFIFSSLWAQLGCMSESTFFDLLAVLPGSWSIFYRRKFFIAVALTTIGGVIIATVDAIFLSNHFALNIFALYIFNCGTMIFLILYRTTLHRQRFEIAASAFLNYQGNSFSFMDIVILLFGLIPPALFAILTFFHKAWYINPICIIAGMLGLVCYKQWMAWIHTSFRKQRYAMMDGFRARV